MQSAQHINYRSRLGISTLATISIEHGALQLLITYFLLKLNGSTVIVFVRTFVLDLDSINFPRKTDTIHTVWQ